MHGTSLRRGWTSRDVVIAHRVFPVTRLRRQRGQITTISEIRPLRTKRKGSTVEVLNGHPGRPLTLISGKIRLAPILSSTGQKLSRASACGGNGICGKNGLGIM